MELALKINDVVLFIVLLCFMVIWLWQLKSKKTKPSKAILAVVNAMMLLVEIWRIVLESIRGGELCIIATGMFMLTVYLIVMVNRNKN